MIERVLVGFFRLRAGFNVDWFFAVVKLVVAADFAVAFSPTLRLLFFENHSLHKNNICFRKKLWVVKHKNNTSIFLKQHSLQSQKL